MSPKRLAGIGNGEEAAEAEADAEAGIRSDFTVLYSHKAPGIRINGKGTCGIIAWYTDRNIQWQTTHARTHH